MTENGNDIKTQTMLPGYLALNARRMWIKSNKLCAEFLLLATLTATTTSSTKNTIFSEKRSLQRSAWCAFNAHEWTNRTNRMHSQNSQKINESGRQMYYGYLKKSKDFFVTRGAHTCFFGCHREGRKKCQASRYGIIHQVQNLLHFWMAEAKAKQRNAHIKSGCTVNGHQRNKRTTNIVGWNFPQLSKTIIMTQASLLWQCDLCMKSRRCKRNSTFSAASFGNARVPDFLFFFHRYKQIFLPFRRYLDSTEHSGQRRQFHEFTKTWKRFGLKRVRNCRTSNATFPINWECLWMEMLIERPSSPHKQSYQRQRCYIEMNIWSFFTLSPLRSMVAIWFRRVSILFYSIHE